MVVVKQVQTEGLLVLAGTPIGDPADAPPRLAEQLRTADIVAAEVDIFVASDVSTPRPPYDHPLSTNRICV